MTETKPQTGTIGQPPEINSTQLLGPKGELTIIHNGERYTLRVTANRKLILTK